MAGFGSLPSTFQVGGPPSSLRQSWPDVGACPPPNWRWIARSGPCIEGCQRGPTCRLSTIADQHISGSGKGAAAKLSAHQKEEFGFEDEGDHGIVVVGASVVPLTAAQREELGEPWQQQTISLTMSLLALPAGSGAGFKSPSDGSLGEGMVERLCMFSGTSATGGPGRLTGGRGCEGGASEFASVGSALYQLLRAGPLPQAAPLGCRPSRCLWAALLLFFYLPLAGCPPHPHPSPPTHPWLQRMRWRRRRGRS